MITELEFFKNSKDSSELIFSNELSSKSKTSKHAPVIFPDFKPETRPLVLTHNPLALLIRTKFLEH